MLHSVASGGIWRTHKEEPFSTLIEPGATRVTNEEDSTLAASAKANAADLLPWCAIK
jgi:hypothetical protein